MTNSEFKKVGRLLKELYKELEAEALKGGVDIFGDEYQILQARVRLALLVKMGFTLEEYVEARDRTVNEQKAERKREMNDLKSSVSKTEQKIPTVNDMAEIAKAYIKAPVITNNTINKIVKEITVKQPIHTKETNTIIEREEYDDRYLMAEIGSLNERLESIKMPEDFDKEGFKKEITNLFGELFEHNINTLGMPNFRKLAMGLQDQLDKLKGSYTTVTTASYGVAPADDQIVCNSTSAITVSLPIAKGTGRELSIKNINTGAVTVDGQGSETIDGETTQTVAQWENIKIVDYATGLWVIV